MGTKEKLKAERKIMREQEEKRFQRNRKILKHGSFAILALIIIGISIFDTYRVKNASETPVSERTPSLSPTPMEQPKLKEIIVDEDRIANKEAVIATEKGEIVIDLLAEAAPKTVMNFVELAEGGFYEGIAFHRVVDGFVVQGGDPLSKENDPSVGSGGPGYQFADEINASALQLSEQVRQSLLVQGYSFVDDLPSKPNVVGAVSMANAGPNTNGSQFFIITEQDQPTLDGKHTVFGMVTSGLDIARSIEQGDTMSITIRTKQ